MQIKWTEQNRFGTSYNEGGQPMELRREGEVSYFTFPSMDALPYVRHGFSTKEGGVSEGEFSTMNLSYSRGDVPERVDENYRRICHALHMKTEDLVLSDQVHDTKVCLVGKKDCQGENLREKKLAGIDGLLTNEKEVVLCTSYADCVPLYLVDTKNQVIGHSHSGWRGTVGKMGANTIREMQKEFGTDPKDLIVGIGPSICQECYEVSEDVAEAFQGFIDLVLVSEQQQLAKEDVERMRKQMIIDKGAGKYQLDLWMANKLVFMEAGVPREQISISCVCTCCNSHLLFSHRKTNGKRGNLAGFLQLV